MESHNHGVIKKGKLHVLLYYCLPLVIGIVVSTKVAGQSYSSIVYDKKQTQYFGAYNLVTLHRGLYSLEDRYLPDKFFEENTFLKKSAGFGCRLAKFLLLDLQIDYVLTTSQHEIFGHGSRVHEVGFTDISYNIQLAPPYGKGGGFTTWNPSLNPGTTFPNRRQTTTIDIGGVDGQQVMANTLSAQVFLDDTLHYRQGLLYLLSQNGLTSYLWLTRRSKPENITPNNDMIAYLGDINNLTTSTIPNPYTLKELSLQSLVSFANPLQLYSVYSLLYKYGVKGERTLNKLPMIRMGKVRYLPAFNYSFTPFGSRYHSLHAIRYKKMLYQLDLNISDQRINKFYGISMKGYHLINRKILTLNFSIDLWKQPSLGRKISHDTANKLAGAFKMDLMVRPLELPNQLGLFIQAGYKSPGYLLGEGLAEGLILRYGISMHL